MYIRGSAGKAATSSDASKVLVMASDAPEPIWRPVEPAPKGVVEALAVAASIPLPAAYLEFLRRCNGGEGDFAAQPLWISFWPAEQVLELNRGYEIDRYFPRFFGFASNGGGELLAFDTRDGEPYPVVMIPFIPLDVEESIVVAADFDDVLSRAGRGL